MLKSFKIKLFFLAWLFCFVANAQTNLVPNPSFEDTINCPISPDDAAKCKFWSPFRASPDYYNSCDPYTYNVSTPYNLAGYQIPSSGVAYMGMVVYVSPTFLPGNYREYLGAKLTNTLTINQKYFFSLKCVATKNTWGPSNCYSSKLGVNFSKTAYTILNPYPITNSAKIFTNTVVNDTVNWKTIKGSFIADSAYQYIILGNFFNNNSTDTLIFDANPNCNSYYLIDDVCLSTDSAFAYNYIPTGILELYKNNNIKVYPNPVSSILNIEGNFSDENYVLTDIFGTIIKRGVFNYKKNQINVSELTNGIYFLELRVKKIKVLINN